MTTFTNTTSVKSTRRPKANQFWRHANTAWRRDRATISAGIRRSSSTSAVMLRKRAVACRRNQRQQRRRQHEQLHALRTALDGDQPARAAQGPTRLGRAFQFAPEPAREHRFPAHHPDEKRRHAQGFHNAAGDSLPAAAHVRDEEQKPNQERHAAREMRRDGRRGRAPEQMHGFFEKLDRVLVSHLGRHAMPSYTSAGI